MAVAITEPIARRISNLQPLWHRSAPRQVIEKHRADSLQAGWTAWQKHLAHRRRPAAPFFLKGRQPPLLWAWPRDWQGAELAEAFDKWVAWGVTGQDKETSRRSAVAERQGDKERTDEQLDSLLFASPLFRLSASAQDVWHALDHVAAAHALPRLAEHLSADSWWELASRLHDLAVEAQELHVDVQSDPRVVVRQQLLAGELPLTLGYLFPEVRALRTLRKPARAALSQALIEWTDGEGLLHGRLLPALGPLWACWTRARWMGERLTRGCWSRDAQLQYEWYVRQAIRLTGCDGQFILVEHDDRSKPPTPPVEEPTWPKELYATALDLVGDRGDCAAAAAMLPGRVTPRRAVFSAKDLPDASLHSEWSALAVLAGDWSRSAVRLAVSFAEEPMPLELAIGRERILAGRLTGQITCDGQPVHVEGEWESLCWESDALCDYLELGVELSHGLRLERQILLAHEDRVLYLAEAVVSGDGRPRQLAHELELPLAPGVAWRPEKETRDGSLVNKKRRAAVLPLSLFEWQCDPRGGRLEAADGKLILKHEANARALYCPLLFDLDQRRIKNERTWRQLTVGEALEIVPHDVAVGFRAQSGRRQWLFYRSLAPADNRTLLGQNISGEFCAGRFKTSGKLEEWIEIEA